eukprot:TRINITY_DN1267_c0_g1_i5.p1 TRINITY_DN1267_c0_g1~~TRINITY_DN1267_c0_g1_i5.p1  ORF type:complete len:261 (-),score=72.65 TRINITY_DN1267_c0_g1_i5:213-995(-)
MKRRQDGKVVKPIKNAKKEPGWTQEEDDFLKDVVHRAKRKSWVNACKAMNKNFTVTRRTAKECRARFQKISRENDAKPWSKGEELVFLCNLHLHEGRWEGRMEAILNRKAENIRQYFLTQLKHTASQIKSMDKERFKALSSTEQLKFQIYLILLLTHSELQPELAKASITDEDCDSCLRQMGFECRQDVVRHIDETIERLQNKVLAKLREKAAGKKTEVDELFHKRAEECPRQQIYMHLLPSEEVNRDHFLIAIYFLTNN